MRCLISIVLSQIKESKVRSTLICIAIILSTTLLSTLILSTGGLIKHTQQNAGDLYGKFDGTYYEINQKQLDDIKLRSEFVNVNYGMLFAQINVNDADVSMCYQTKGGIELSKINIIEGSFPDNDNEIMGSKEMFAFAGCKSPKVGDKVEINYTTLSGKSESSQMVISGIIESSENDNYRKSYTAYVSEYLINKCIDEKNRVYTVTFDVYDKESAGYSGTIDEINSITSELNISENNLDINKAYLMWGTTPDKDTIIIAGLIVAIIAGFSIMVIYNIYRVGIVKKIQEYGKLRAIGITKKQLKRSVMLEGVILAIPCIITGCIVGIIGTKLFFKYLVGLMSSVSVEAFSLNDLHYLNFKLIGIAALVAFVSVMIALFKPMMMVAKISPIEALRFQEYGKKKKRKGNSEVNILKLTMSNMALNKRRTISTMLTMGLSCILFIIVANVVCSLDPSFEAKENMENSDYVIKLNVDGEAKIGTKNSLETIQKKGLLNDKTVESIESIKGVESINTRKIIRAENKKLLEEDNNYTSFAVLSKEEFEKKASNLARGNMNYENAVKNDGIIYCWDSWLEEYGYKIGEKYDYDLVIGDKRIAFSGKLIGTVKFDHYDMYITEDTFNKLIKDNGINTDLSNLTSEIWINCKNSSKDNVSTFVNNIKMSSDYIETNSYDQELKIAEASVRVMREPSLLLLALVGFIGFMNMANTLITSIFTRKREFGMLQAVGMSNKQLNFMLQLEGIIITAGTLIFAIIIGNIIGYEAFNKAVQEEWFGVKEYHFPYVMNIGMIVIMFVLQSTLSVVMSKNMKKTSIIDRIRYMG